MDIDQADSQSELGICTGMKHKEIVSFRVSCTLSTAGEKASVIDVVVRPESTGVAGYAGWQGRRYKCQIGAHGAGETPVPIPNTEVKPNSGYYTWVLALGK